MAGYLVNKDHQDNSVVSIKELDGYVFRPRPGHGNYINVNEVKIVDRVMIDKILSMKFNKSFKQLVSLALKVINDESDSSETDEACTMVLGEVELVREVLLNKYQKFLSYEKEQLFLKKLRLIENELRMKQVRIKQKAMWLERQQEEEMTRGRSR